MKKMKNKTYQSYLDVVNCNTNCDKQADTIMR